MKTVKKKLVKRVTRLRAAPRIEWFIRTTKSRSSEELRGTAGQLRIFYWGNRSAAGHLFVAAASI
jgi:hypothetical protein